MSCGCGRAWFVVRQDATHVEYDRWLSAFGRVPAPLIVYVGGGWRRLCRCDLVCSLGSVGRIGRCDCDGCRCLFLVGWLVGQILVKPACHHSSKHLCARNLCAVKCEQRHPNRMSNALYIYADCGKCVTSKAYPGINRAGVV